MAAAPNGGAKQLRRFHLEIIPAADRFSDHSNELGDNQDLTCALGLSIKIAQHVSVERSIISYEIFLAWSRSRLLLRGAFAIAGTDCSSRTSSSSPSPPPSPSPSQPRSEPITGQGQKPSDTSSPNAQGTSTRIPRQLVHSEIPGRRPAKRRRKATGSSGSKWLGYTGVRGSR